MGLTSRSSGAVVVIGVAVILVITSLLFSPLGSRSTSQVGPGELKSCASALLATIYLYTPMQHVSAAAFEARQSPRELDAVSQRLAAIEALLTKTLASAPISRGTEAAAALLVTETKDVVPPVASSLRVGTQSQTTATSTAEPPQSPVLPVQPSVGKYLLYGSFGNGYSNRRIQLLEAMSLAIMANRTLLVPWLCDAEPVSYLFDGPTLNTELGLVEDLAPWQERHSEAEPTVRLDHLCGADGSIQVL